MKIFKEELKIEEDIEQKITANSILKVKILEGKLFVWFYEGLFEQAIILKKTGQNVSTSNMIYVDTVFNDDGHLYHVHTKYLKVVDDLKYSKEIDEILEDVFRAKWMSDDEYKELYDELIVKQPKVKAELSKAIDQGIENGYGLEEQLDITRLVLKKMM